MNPDKVIFSVNWGGPATPFRNTWSTIANVDQFRWLSRADMLEQLAMAKKELGIRFVRACAMYSPEMAIRGPCLPDWNKPREDRCIPNNWQFVDLNLEHLLALGLKPVYTTCFTPEDFTSDPTTCWPDRNRTGMPDDLARWSDFVSEGIAHHVARYGADEVRSWLFECWNEPNLHGCFFGGSMDDFFRLWEATWNAVKRVDGRLLFGGPSTARGEWIREFIQFTRESGTEPDYLVSHVYNNDSGSAPLSPFDGPASHKVEGSAHFASGVIRGVRQTLQQMDFDKPVHWNEWGRSWFLHDPLKESPLEAAFICKTMAEVSQEADEFAFWCLSDIYDQSGRQSAEFQGNYGMLSLHGLRKPAWFAHCLLNRLGSQRLEVSGGSDLVNAVATRSENGFDLLIYAYPAKEGSDIEEQNLELKLPESARRIEIATIDATRSNVIRTWNDMGSPEYPSPEALKTLRAANHIHSETVKNPAPLLLWKMECPGVVSLRITT